MFFFCVYCFLCFVLLCFGMFFWFLLLVDVRWRLACAPPHRKAAPRAQGHNYVVSGLYLPASPMHGACLADRGTARPIACAWPQAQGLQANGQTRPHARASQVRGADRFALGLCRASRAPRAESHAPTFQVELEASVALSAGGWVGSPWRLAGRRLPCRSDQRASTWCLVGFEALPLSYLRCT